MTDITVSIAGGESKTFSAPVSVQDALKELVSNKQRKQAVAVLSNGEPVDLPASLSTDAVLEPVTMQSEEGLHILRHSSAHIMAQAVKELYGQDVKVAIGPAIEDGYYYDFDREVSFTPDDFAAIEEKDLPSHFLLNRHYNKDKALYLLFLLEKVFQIINEASKRRSAAR